MTRKAIFVSAFLLLSLSPLLRADNLDFALIGDGSTYTFQLPSSPTPSGSNSGVFTIANVIVTANGQELAAEVAFFNQAAGGGMDFVRDTPQLTGKQVYSVDQSTIIFVNGTYDLMNSQDGSPYTLTINTDRSTSPPPSVPEPSTDILLLTGIVATAVLEKKHEPRKRRSRDVFAPAGGTLPVRSAIELNALECRSIRLARENRIPIRWSLLYRVKRLLRER